MLHWSNNYIGIPFVAHGRTHSGCDCWGLVCLVQKEVFSRAFPLFDESYGIITPQENARIIDTELPLLPLERTSSPVEGDIVLMKIHGFPSHVGIYLNTGFVLQSDMWGKGVSHLERITSPSIRTHLEGYYRVKD